jgi:crossover junction endodeoxyribonuclease RuvC
MTTIYGLDLSLTQTGWASPTRTGTYKPRGITGTERLNWIRNRIIDMITCHPGGQPHVVIEGYAYGARHQAHQIGELGGAVRLALFDRDIPFTEVSPSTLKKLATGKGNSNKYGVMAAATKRLGYEGTNDNEADALWLRQYGLHLFGLPGAVKLPKAHMDAMKGTS